MSVTLHTSSLTMKKGGDNMMKLRKAKKITLSELRETEYDWRSIKEEARRLGLSTTTIYNRCMQGEYIVRSFFGLTLIRPSGES